MGIPNIFNTGRSGMVATKTAIATAGHNIANANTEGYSRQRVQTTTVNAPPTDRNGLFVGMGAKVSRVERINDEYVEKQIRNAGREMAQAEDKDIVLKQTEDIFNEMNGDGINRLVARFFNEFRKLANEPDNEAIRESVREASAAMVNDFHRIRRSVEDVRAHIDSRLEGHASEVNALGDELKELNLKIKGVEMSGASPNDLLDKRDATLRKLASYADLQMHKDDDGNYVVNIRGIGPFVAGPAVEKFHVERTPADGQGKPENAVDISTSASASSVVTHSLKGGRMGALLEARDQTLSTVLSRLDDLAYEISRSVNEIHTQGFTRHGLRGVAFFKPIEFKERAAELIDLSDAVKNNVNNIATAAVSDSPGDNRIAIAISGIQGLRIMNEGRATMDDWYNSIVSDVGVAAAKNRNSMSQQRDIITQLGKMREQISGVSIDEETTNLMQLQHAFGASAKVIQVADEMLKTVLDMRR